MKIFLIGFCINLLLKEISPSSQTIKSLYNLSHLINMWSKALRFQPETFRTSEQQLENSALYAHFRGGISSKRVPLPYLKQPWTALSTSKGPDLTLYLQTGLLL